MLFLCRITEHCIKKRLQWNTSFVRKVCREAEYYEDMMRYLRRNLAVNLTIHQHTFALKSIMSSPFWNYKFLFSFAAVSLPPCWVRVSCNEDFSIQILLWYDFRSHEKWYYLLTLVFPFLRLKAIVCAHVLGIIVSQWSGNFHLGFFCWRTHSMLHFPCFFFIIFLQNLHFYF